MSEDEIYEKVVWEAQKPSNMPNRIIEEPNDITEKRLLNTNMDRTIDQVIAVWSQ